MIYKTFCTFKVYSLTVEHTAHNGKNIGSSPIILKKFYYLIFLFTLFILFY